STIETPPSAGGRRNSFLDNRHSEEDEATPSSAIDTLRTKLLLLRRCDLSGCQEKKSHQIRLTIHMNLLPILQ
ncbi:hypothetical protein LINPERHAP1_LOCUS23154, partial [Linum perenne]